MRLGFPINRSISSAKDNFSIVDEEEYLALPSPQRHGLIHQPLSSIEIITASPLHTYRCVFHWYMLLIYHIHSYTFKWSPTSRSILDSMKFARDSLHEKTGFKIDQASSDGVTTSTGNMARCSQNKKNSIY